MSGQERFDHYQDEHAHGEGPAYIYDSPGEIHVNSTPSRDAIEKGHEFLEKNKEIVLWAADKGKELTEKMRPYGNVLLVTAATIAAGAVAIEATRRMRKSKKSK
jgi:hypothetical protein